MRIDQFKKELMEWLNTVPRTQPIITALSTFSTTEWFQLAYNHSVLLLHRRLLVKAQRHESLQVLLECCHAARDICYLYRKLFLNNPVSYTWGALHILFLAGLTFLHCLITSPGVRATFGQDEISDTCTSCTIVLVIMAERWKAAAAYRDTWELLAKATISMLVKAGSARSVPSMDQDMGNQGKWAEALPMPVFSDTTGERRQEMAEYLDDMADIGMCAGTEELLNQFLGDMSG